MSIDNSNDAVNFAVNFFSSFMNKLKSRKDRFIKIIKDFNIQVVKNDPKQTALNIVQGVKTNLDFVAELSMLYKDNDVSSYNGEDPKINQTILTLRTIILALGDNAAADLIAPYVSDLDTTEETITTTEVKKKDYTYYYIAGIVLFVLIVLAIVFRKKIASLF